MSTLFYDHLISIEPVKQRLAIHLTQAELDEFLQHLDEVIHAEVTELILSHLPSEHHEEFVTLVHQKPHDASVLAFVQERTQSDIEEVIRAHVHELVQTLLTSVPTGSFDEQA